MSCSLLDRCKRKFNTKFAGRLLRLPWKMNIWEIDLLNQNINGKIMIFVPCEYLILKEEKVLSLLQKCSKNILPSGSLIVMNPMVHSVKKSPEIKIPEIHQNQNCIIPGPSMLGAKWFRYRVSSHHPLGFKDGTLTGRAGKYPLSLIHIFQQELVLMTCNPVRPPPSS